MNSVKKILSKTSGFTLIELLIVIAVIGVLAAVLLVALDPVEQLARSRDAGRKSTVAQVGKAVAAYYASKSYYPGSNATWASSSDSNSLVSSGDIKTLPAAQSYQQTGGAGACTQNVTNNICYLADNATAASTTVAIVYASLESKTEQSKCATNTKPFYVWSSADGRAGLVCVATNSQPTYGAQTFSTNN